MCSRTDTRRPPGTRGAPTSALLIPMRLDTHHTLPEGTRVRLRLPQMRDRVGLVDLLARLGLEADEMDVARILRFDPRGRSVICATVWTGSSETLAGLVAGTKDGSGPDLLVADERLTPGLTAVLRDMQDTLRGAHRAA